MNPLSSFAALRTLVVGDVMLDRYLFGSAQRISPEAPVPVVAIRSEDYRPGGAANVAASMAALGAHVCIHGIVGEDRDGHDLRQRLASTGTIQTHFVADSATPTICKTRLVAGSWQQLVRFDRDGVRSRFEALSDRVVQEVLPQIKAHQVVVLADYEKGTLTPAAMTAIIDECRRQGVPCLVDPKKTDFTAYRGATLLTPNVLEAERALGRELRGDEAIAAAAQQLREQLATDYMLITRGSEGMTLVDQSTTKHFRAEVREVADVSGAGDTVVAALAVAIAAQWQLADACQLAGVAAGVAVSHPGTYVVSANELSNAWHHRSTKICEWSLARTRIADAQKSGRKVVFTNGCFDILHAGHLYCLEEARKLGDLLIIGLNSDASVRMNKGESRPVIQEANRAALLAGLACVDMVVLFDELTPENLVRHLGPDVLVKGGDYNVSNIAGADFVRARGGEVITIPLVDGLSTTSILQRVPRAAN